MKGIFVIDGPDACGKSTLANNFQLYCAHHNIPFLYQHAEYRFKERMFQYHEAILRKAIKHSQHGIAVIDRLHWSEYVYAKVYREGSAWPLQWRFFDRLLQKHGAYNIIACGRSPDQVLKWHREACKSRKEMYKPDIRMAEVAAEFINIYAARAHRSDYFFYDRSLHDKDATISVTEIVDYFIYENQKFRQEQFPDALQTSCYNLLGYVPRAEVLFLGDELNNKGRHQTWPFWEYRHSSLHMTQTLDELNFDESLAVWTNYKCDESQFYLHELLEYNKNLKVIALGKFWITALKKENIRYTEVFHPSYARRFNVTDYKDVLKEALCASTF